MKPWLEFMRVAEELSFEPHDIAGQLDRRGTL